MALFWLSDEAWSAIKPHWPKNQPGARRVDDSGPIPDMERIAACDDLIELTYL
jgi:transposase